MLSIFIFRMYNEFLAGKKNFKLCKIVWIIKLWNTKANESLKRTRGKSLYLEKNEQIDNVIFYSSFSHS